MRMPRVTIRMMMVVIAIAGTGMASVRLSPQSKEFARRALFHKRVAHYFKIGRCGCVAWDPESEDSKRKASYHRRLRSKYERAARYPWPPVEPDPPEP